MIKNRLFSLASLLVVLSLLLTACGPAEPAGLGDEEVLAVTTQVLQAIDSGDYAAFTQDFSPDMLAAFSETQFTQLHDTLQSASGNFVSTGELSITNKQEYALYRILCTYELEEVVVTIVFKIGGVQVEGLFFDSPNLRSASK